MQTFQIANGYFQSDLFQRLFLSLEDNHVETQVFVPVEKAAELPPVDANVFVAPCFSSLDRMLFFPKQQRILNCIESNFDLTSIDIIHAHTVFSGGYVAYQLHKRHGIPYIIAVRNTDVNLFFKYMLHLRSIGIKIMSNAKKIIFLSSAYQDLTFLQYIPVHYQNEIRKKSAVVPNGISPLFFEQLSAPKTLSGGLLRLIYVGEINSNKNLETTIQAIRLLRDRGLDIALTVVGPILEEKYQHIIAKAEFIEYHDRCSQENVITYLRKSDIFVMPSHAETFGLVYAEAMSQGLPVLYTRGQGFDGQFADGTVGYAVLDTDPQELADKIEQVVANYSKLSANCIRLVNKFNWDSIAKQYKEIYETIIEGD